MKKYRNTAIIILSIVLVFALISTAVYFKSQQSDKKAAETGELLEEEIIKSVGPADIINASPGETVTLLIVAKNGADVYVRFGATRYDAAKPAKNEGYSAYFVKIKMPKKKAELASMGKITVVATLDGQTQQLDGPEIRIAGKGSTSSTKADSSTVYNIDNYTPTYTDDGQQVRPSINEAISRATTNPFTTPFTGNQMAVVTADSADTKPIDADTDYVPCFPALARGTTDYVVGESSSIDEDEGETYYYYNLASGLKVKRDSVMLQTAATMPDNVLKLNSVYGSDGEITIRLGSTWKVPYFANLENQNYYSVGQKHFNVTDFSATGLTLSFHYTTSATGNIDCSASDIVSSAYWSFSPENKIANLHLPFRQPGVYYGFSVSYEGDETVITVKGRPKGLQGSVVVLDPGHGFDDGGATGLNEAVKESDINILVAYQVKSALEQQGVTVYMTRYGDDDINLEGRKIFARNVNPDIFVSIHSDGSENKDSRGTTAYYYKPFSMPLASNIYTEMISVYKNSFYPGQYDLYEEIDRGVQYYPFSVTRLDECPSALIEIGFMTNDAECYMLTRTENQQLIGQAIARGICKTLTQ